MAVAQQRWMEAEDDGWHLEWMGFGEAKWMGLFACLRPPKHANTITMDSRIRETKYSTLSSTYNAVCRARSTAALF